MRCPECGSLNTGCKDSRESKTYPGKRWRRHKCQECGEIFSTIEITLEEYENLTTGMANHDALRKMKDRAVDMLLTARKAGGDLQRAAVENALRHVLGREE